MCVGESQKSDGQKKRVMRKEPERDGKGNEVEKQKNTDYTAFCCGPTHVCM